MVKRRTIDRLRAAVLLGHREQGVATSLLVS